MGYVQHRQMRLPPRTRLLSLVSSRPRAGRILRAHVPWSPRWRPRSMRCLSRRAARRRASTPSFTTARRRRRRRWTCRRPTLQQLLISLRLSFARRSICFVTCPQHSDSVKAWRCVLAGRPHLVNAARTAWRIGRLPSLLRASHWLRCLTATMAMRRPTIARSN